ncbi:MAG: hypothetical protein U0694_09545 [Anaerolineae bacterium]
MFPFITFALALFQFGAAYRAATTPPPLAAVVALPLGLELVLSGLWALLFGSATFALLRQKSRAVFRALMLISVFIIYSAVRLLLFAQADYDRQRLPFLFIIVILLLIFPVIYLIRRSYGDSYGNKR